MDIEPDSISAETQPLDVQPHGAALTRASSGWDDILTRLHHIFERRRVLRVILFGSLAREETSRRSDVDLLVIQRTGKHWLDRYEGILREVSQAVPGRDVDMLIYTPDELDRLRDRPLIARALREGKIIYESDEEPTSS